MGVNIKQAGFAALTLAAVLLPLRKPSRDLGVTSTVDPRQLRLDSLSWQHRAAHYSWLAFELRDSAAVLIAHVPAGPSRPTISYRGFAKGATDAEADSIVDRLWAQLGSADARVHTAVLEYSVAAFAQPTYTGTLISRSDERTDCVAIVPAWLHRDGTPAAGRFAIRDALAPCALLAAFGNPGAGVGAWLDSTRYMSAQSNSWLIPDSITTDWRSGPWVEWSEAESNRFMSRGMFDRLESVGLLELEYQRRPHYEYGAAGLRCLNGDFAACERGVLHSGIARPDTSIAPADLTLSAYWTARPREVTLATVRPPTASMLSAMITEFGRTRFQKFWSSDQPFEPAFRAAFGESLGSWTARWAHDRWLGTFEAKMINADVLLGVTLEPSAVPVVVVWSIVGLAIAAWVARRRTVSS